MARPEYPRRQTGPEGHLPATQSPRSLGSPGTAPAQDGAFLAAGLLTLLWGRFPGATLDTGTSGPCTDHLAGQGPEQVGQRMRLRLPPRAREPGSV